MPSGVRFAINKALKAVSRNASEEGAEGFFKAGAKKPKSAGRRSPRLA